MDELVLLLGPNGTGKSAVLDVLSALRNLLSGRPKVNDPDVFPSDSVTAWRPARKPTQTFELDINTQETGDLTYRLEVEHDLKSHRSRVLVERLSGVRRVSRSPDGAGRVRHSCVEGGVRTRQ